MTLDSCTSVFPTLSVEENLLVAEQFTQQQHRRLQREHHLAVEVLVQAVVVAGAVAQEQRGGAGLPGGMAKAKVLSAFLSERFAGQSGGSWRSAADRARATNTGSSDASSRSCVRR